ncbi:membrane protein [Novosphingobium sediminis]|uniref:Membrane protein n=1 Tax=Novosphingobium sediminis TaxID=707214 RepID=A0A512AF31_9SPHN|nr:MAPEG family protein [Novosphingobium sediminis]GEN98286.1 membrane protein [Novosphingobium sediminis]
MQKEMLAPATALVLWTLVMLVWLGRTRLPALRRLGGLGKVAAGGRGQELESIIPAQISWKSHNYTHLHEQPTLFYAVCMILAMTGATRIDVLLAWGYVAVRVAHSLWQALVNTIPVRFTLFMTSSALLFALAVRAAVNTLLP